MSCGQVVVMSATLDQQLFLNYFPGSVALSVPGRQHPVQVMYAFQACQDYVEAAITTAIQVGR